RGVTACSHGGSCKCSTRRLLSAVCARWPRPSWAVNSSVPTTRGPLQRVGQPTRRWLPKLPLRSVPDPATGPRLQRYARSWSSSPGRKVACGMATVSGLQTAAGRSIPEGLGTMQAAVVEDFSKPLALREIAIPLPGPGEVLVKIETSGLCHTDIHAAKGHWPIKPKLPLIPGHEGVGIVQLVGPGVTEVKEGDRVGLPWLGYACGACEYCASGWETLCQKQLNTGYGIDGAYAQDAVCSAKFAANVA